MTIPDYVQKKYDRVLSDGLPGSNADANPTYDATFIAEGGEIAFGRVISVGSTMGPPVRARIGASGNAASKGYALGTGVLTETLGSWTGITDGEFSLYIDNVYFEATAMDFSSVTSLIDIATVIENKIQSYTAGGPAFTDATVEYGFGQFKITSGSEGATSTVNYIGGVPGGHGTDIVSMLGFDTFLSVDGTLLVATAKVLGLVLRELTHEGGANDSGTTVVKEGSVGAFRQDGTVKVLCTENSVAGADVYFDKITGEIVSSAGANRAKLGTSKFINSVSAGSVGVVDLTGIR